MDYPAINPQVFDREVVIKVKYGNILKRFNTRVYGQYLDYDITRLRMKIINVFKLSPDAELTLTYTDEDNDIVTLDDDDDLHAAVKQQLNPIRITAQMKCDASADAELTPQSANPTPRSPNSNFDPAQLGSAVEEALKSLPEHVRTKFSKLSQDIFSKAVASAPPLAETLQFLSKLEFLNDTRPSNGSMGQSSVNVNASNEQKDNPVPERSDKQPKTDHTSLEVRTEAPQNHGAAGFSPIDDVLPYLLTKNNDEKKNVSKVHHSPYSDSLIVEPLGCHEVPKMPTFPHYGVGTDAVGNETIKQKALGTLLPSTFGGGFIRNDVPSFHGWPLGAPSNAVPRPGFGYSHFEHPYRPYIGDGYPESMLHTFHRGVQCDGCGMNPISGPRYKSKVKDNYDLCSICFSRMGNKDDYTRMDKPSPFPHKMFNHHPKSRCVSLGFTTRPTREKLEGRFIKDVAVHDGTMMAPNTKFTKIWRMRNNGTTPWPYGTRIVWVGGDHIASQDRVQLEIPTNGFAVDKEIDIAVDFIAPPLPGRYISYWRLAAPLGQKFGQRVWVLIQVESPSPPTSGSKLSLNLNLPPAGSSSSVIEMMGTNVETKDEAHPQPNVTNTAEELIKPLVDDGPVIITDEPVEPPIVVVPPVQYPAVDFPTSAPPQPPPSPLLQAFNHDNSVEEVMLKELEEMGFKQIDLNKEVLRQNKYDLDQSVGDLCGFSEWDPLLIELEEMGFADKERNKKMLEKNGGSIKRAVMDLVAEEKKPI
ncbi:protein NBR1 homolog [Ananas comosus]|uniref:Protein NBR1 homolog n=2 Tax=Ananas comosus TaxID=4615 RepID=A0A6P5GWX8_ANACO|nr:protein NBR1 homolog [Ananas comosus]